MLKYKHNTFNRKIKVSNIHKMKNKKIPHCRNNYKIKYQNRRKRQSVTHKCFFSSPKN
jgi:hypothetical protein